MAYGKMPRRFWSYTGGKGDIRAEERDAAREKMLQTVKENVPGLVALGLVGLLTLLILLMMFAEFRGFYISQISELFRVR